MKNAKAEIITIGTELLLGQITNTNARWLSEQLAEQGISVYYHTVVGDNRTRVKNMFQLAQDRSDIIIVSGGLGPTEDDMTREAFQELTGMEMTEHQPSIDKIKKFYLKRNRTMTPNNHRQARVFQNAHVIHNEIGMAPGMIVKHKEKVWVFLPGVPNELKNMMHTTVMPYFANKLNQKMIIRSLTIKFMGIGESQLEHDLIDLIRKQDNPTIAPLAQKKGLIIRLTAKDETLEKVTARLKKTKIAIYEKVGNYIYGINDETIEQKVYELLKEQNKNLSAAESLTGGMFTEQLIGVNGASEICPGGIVTYDAETKHRLLNVSKETIETDGVVSEDCAIEMARNVRYLLQTHIGISFTGVAGPDELEGHEVGTVFICIDTADKNIVRSFLFHGDRNDIRRRTVQKGYEILFKLLNKHI